MNQEGGKLSKKTTPPQKKTKQFVIAAEFSHFRGRDIQKIVFSITKKKDILEFFPTI
jgi:capsid portal protein